MTPSFSSPLTGCTSDAARMSKVTRARPSNRRMDESPLLGLPGKSRPFYRAGLSVGQKNGISHTMRVSIMHIRIQGESGNEIPGLAGGIGPGRDDARLGCRGGTTSEI